MVQNQSVGTSAQGNLSLWRGALAGMAGTVPMTIFMLLMHRLLPNWQRYALPPERITDALAKRAGVGKKMDKQQRVGTAVVAHFGYGASMGMMYSLFARLTSLPTLVKGIVFGLAVWGGSYLGLLPAMSIPSSADDETVRRNMLMIVAHVIWGTATGMVVDWLASSLHPRTGASGQGRTRTGASGQGRALSLP